MAAATETVNNCTNTAYSSLRPRPTVAVSLYKPHGRCGKRETSRGGLGVPTVLYINVPPLVQSFESSLSSLPPSSLEKLFQSSIEIYPLLQQTSIRTSQV